MDENELCEEFAELEQEQGLTVYQDAPVALTAHTLDIEKAQQYVNSMKVILSLFVQCTNQNDWIDMGGKPYLQKSGCSKVATTFGLKFNAPTLSVVNETEEDGYKYRIYSVAGSVIWNGTEKFEVGTATTKDSLFSVRKVAGETIRLSLKDIDLANVQKKAYTNWMNRCLKAVFGMNPTWDELAEMSNGKIVKSTGITYRNETKASETDEDKALRSEVRELILKTCGGDSAKARDLLLEKTTFTTQEGNVIKGKTDINAVSVNQLRMLKKTL
jgi:hypothetical protein